MFRTLHLMSFTLALFAATSHAAEARKPNIILILADDLGYETLGCNGGESYKTPHLDRLAETGMRFERCNVQPLCSPTRVQLMTGMYNVRNYSAWGVIDPHTTTFGNLLKNAGYATAIGGKWQFGKEKDLPQKLGFEESYLWLHLRRGLRYANPGLDYNGEKRDFHNGEYGPDVVSDFALDFVEKHKSKPFFLYYPMMLTHAPYQPTPDSPDWDPKINDVKTGHDRKHFADMVAYMDKLVGRLVAKVDEQGIRDNTLILFLGDNGTGQGLQSRLHGTTYDGGKGGTNARGMHVPLIVNWPGHTKAGSLNDDLIDSTDFLPTICEAAGAKIPDALTIDGHSFLPQINGETGKPREWIYTWYAKDGAPPFREFVTTKQYKLYRNGRFFDLTKDPYEEKAPQQLADLTGTEKQMATKLKAVLARYANSRPDELMAKVSADTAPKPDPEKKAARQQRRQARKAAAE